MTQLPAEKLKNLLRIVSTEAKIQTWGYQNIKQQIAVMVKIFT
jgi:hypothetical protein